MPAAGSITLLGASGSITGAPTAPITDDRSFL
jgi:hypothetical protein